MGVRAVSGRRRAREAVEEAVEERFFLPHYSQAGLASGREVDRDTFRGTGTLEWEH